MRKIVLLCLTVFVLASCNTGPSKQKQKFDDLREEVLKEHDEVMKHLPKVNALIQKLESKADSTTVDNDYQNRAESLKVTYDSMFDWMHNLNEDLPDIAKKDKTYTDEEYEEQTEILKIYRDEMIKVEEAFKENISKAESLLDSGK